MKYLTDIGMCVDEDGNVHFPPVHICPGSNWARLMNNWRNSHTGCWVCHDYNLGPMVHNEVWVKIEPVWTRMLLCQKHMEERLGRPIVKADLRDCPWNEYRREVGLTP